MNLLNVEYWFMLQYSSNTKIWQ